MYDHYSFLPQVLKCQVFFKERRKKVLYDVHILLWGSVIKYHLPTALDDCFKIRRLWRRLKDQI